MTVHTIIPSTTGSLKLTSALLSCQRSKGSHTGERIAAAFDDVIEENGIENKIDFVVTDNASNMKAAFKVRFPTPDVTEEAEDEGENIEDEAVWHDLEEEDEEQVFTVLENSSKQRLSCFAHSLQLVIGDGLKETRGLATAIAKASRLSTLLHRSTVFKEK